MLSIETLVPQLVRPRPYEPGASLWTDPHIAKGMLETHLSPDTDLASFRPETIAAICGFLPARMGLAPGAKIVDLGCGPGLYCRNLAARGHQMTGVDWSENSIRYARELCEGLPAVFRRASYLEPFGEAEFDAALLIYEDFGVLPPGDRKTLLGNIDRALKPGGIFALDVASRAAFERRRAEPDASWEAAARGFWRPHPYAALNRTYFYPDIPASCDLHAILDGEASVYRVWQTYYTRESLAAELGAGGFEVTEFFSSLKGDACADGAPAIAALCRKRQI
jgi:SAM-dependent methyltransferase